MGYGRLSLWIGCATMLVVLGSAASLRMGFEEVTGSLPAGSDELRFQVLSTTQLQFSYRLPRGFTWTTVYERLGRQGWIVRDDEILVWPEMLDDGRAAAVFWRTGWLRLGRQLLKVHRDSSDQQKFVVEIIQCAPNVFSASCV